MTEGGIRKQRRSPRSKLLMAARLDHRDGSLCVTLRDLSTDGALIEGDHELQAGAPVVFRKNELVVPGRIAWAQERRAGIAFDSQLDPELVMRHVPTPTPRPMREEVHKRPGLRARLSREERLRAEMLYGRPLPSAEK